MTLARRIIPCLDVRNGRVVKGVSFVNLVDAGDPVALGKAYADAGADELVFLDITASVTGARVVDSAKPPVLLRAAAKPLLAPPTGKVIDAFPVCLAPLEPVCPETPPSTPHVRLVNSTDDSILTLVEQVADHVTIPFTVGGGVRTVDDMRALLRAGADKVTVNTAAVNDPSLLDALAALGGSQCVVLAIDAKWTGDRYEVFTRGGRTATGREVATWAREATARGAGEILLTSMDRDGQKSGFDCRLLKCVSEAVTVPVIASGGAGELAHFAAAIREGGADAVLAASIFHFGAYTIRQAKEYLRDTGISVRI